MTAALIVLALLLAGTVPAAIAMGYKSGTLRGDLTVARDERRRAIKLAAEADGSADERIRRKDLVIAGLRAKMQRLREHLQNHPDPAVRGAVALDGVLGLLSEMQNADGPAADSDNEAGPVPTGMGS